MYRSTACLLVIALGGCFSDVEPATIEIDDTAGNDAREVIAAPGDTIRFGNLVFVVPEEVGEAVGGIGETADGWASFEIENRGDGIVAVRAESMTIGTGVLTAEASAACSDGAYKLHRRWNSTYRWHLSTINSPTAAQEDMIRRGANHIVNSHNNCGLADNVSATHEYLGRKSAPMRIDSDAAGYITCDGRDGQSIVGFGYLGGTFKAYTCWYSNTAGYLAEVDIKFKQDLNWITTHTVPDNCTDRLHLESVATHEFGHAFGLLHPDGDHPALTMQPGGSCDASKSSLGLGDVRGLRALY